MIQYVYERPVVEGVIKGVGMKKRLLHIVTGPRQVGKTTAALQLADKWNGPVINASVDYIVKTPKKLWGIEVKSGRPKHPKGVSEFLKSYPDAKMLIIGSQGMSLEEFFRTDPRAIF